MEIRVMSSETLYYLEDGRELRRMALPDRTYLWRLYERGQLAAYTITPVATTALAALEIIERELVTQYHSELFAHVTFETLGELDSAYAHIRAGDKLGAFQHLIQFAKWAVSSQGHVPGVEHVWREYGPRPENGHQDLIYETRE